MRRIISAVGAFILLASSAGLGYAFPSISYTSVLDIPGKGGYTSSVSTATVETFDLNGNGAFTQGWSWIGSPSSYNIVSGNVAGKYSAPAYDLLGVDTKEKTFYISVPDANSNGNDAVLAVLGGKYNYFGLWWGSIDSYNTLTFYNGGTKVATVTGNDLTNPANGNQWAPDTNKYVNLNFGPTMFDAFALSSTNFAFEVDNIAIANLPVPEPGTIVLLGAGLLGLGLYGRRRIKK